jgi:hypothetical protein
MKLSFYQQPRACSDDCLMAFYVASVQFPSSSINCQASFVGISHTCTTTNKHHLNNSQNSSRERAGFGEVTGKVVGVSKMAAGYYMQERYNRVTRQNKGEKMQTLGVQKGGGL